MVISSAPTSPAADAAPITAGALGSDDVWGLSVPVRAPLDPVEVAHAIEALANDWRLSNGSRANVTFLGERAPGNALDERMALERALLVAPAALAAPGIGWAFDSTHGWRAISVVTRGLHMSQPEIADFAHECARRLELGTARQTAGALPELARSGRGSLSALAAARPAIEAQIAHWRHELGRYQDVGLPGRHPRGAAATSQIARRIAVLTPSARRKLAALAADLDCDLADVLMTTFAAVLRRSLLDDEIVLAACVARREQTQPAVAGRRLNLIGVRIDLAGDPAFAEAVSRTRSALAAAMHHGDVSIDRIAAGDTDCTLPSIAFACTDGAAAAAMQTVPIAVGRLRGSSVASALPELRLRCSLADDRIDIVWEFDRCAYSDGQIAQTAGRYLRFLAALPDCGSRGISRIPLLDATDRAALMVRASGERRPYERDSTIQALWSDRVAQTPDAPALADAGGQLTYAQVERRANRLAHHLIAAGVEPGAAVGVTFERSIELPITLLAILKAGACYLALDARYPPERLDMMIDDAALAVIVVDGGPAPKFAGRTISLMNERSAIAARPTDAPAIRGAATDHAYITYTSGSTGRPKGVRVTHRGVVRLVRNVDYVNIRASDGFLSHAPLAFDASTFEIWAPLLNGARLGLPRPGLLTMTELAHAIRAFEVTTMFLTTSLFERLVDSGLGGFERLRQLLTGGEVASPTHMRRFIERYPACHLSAVYGPTENTTFSTWHPLPTVDAVGTNVAIGRPIANSTAYVVDAHGELTAPDVPGELWVGGDGVADGYLNRPDLSDERFCDDPFDTSRSARIYKTGDRARWRSDGALEFLGRTDHQVKVRGFRIELGEIEAVVRTHRQVVDAAVVVAAGSGEKTLAAFVVPVLQSGLTEADVQAFLAAKLPRYLHPHRMTLVGSLPQHASGKIDRVTLAARALQPEPAPTPTSTPAPTPTSAPTRFHERPGSLQRATPLRRMQQTIADVWQNTLGIAPPSLDVNFFDAGGDSLRLLTVHAALAQRLGRDIAIMDLFAHTTIRTLAANLSAQPEQP